VVTHKEGLVEPKPSHYYGDVTAELLQRCNPTFEPVSSALNFALAIADLRA